MGVESTLKRADSLTVGASLHITVVSCLLLCHTFIHELLHVYTIWPL